MLDYCSSLYSGLPSGRLACLDRVLRSAARLIGRIPKFGHVSNYMLETLHWLPIRQRIVYRIASLVWRCQLGLAPSYLRDLCRPVSGAQGSRSLRSSERGCSQSRLPAQLLCKIVLSQWWAQPSGMGCPWNCACFPERSLTYSILTWKLFFLAVLESGAPLSSYLEEVLYKSPEWMNEWMNNIN